jgi:Na+/H+ antiporter NhaA
MSQQANITVFDGASTPVTHTLQGESVEKSSLWGSIATWVEQLSTVPAYAQIRAMLIKRKLKSGTLQCINRVVVPVMEAVAGVNSSGYTAPPKVAYEDRFELVSYTDPRSTEASKRLAMQILLNWSNNVTTTATPVSVGVVADLHQRGLQVT